MWTLSILVCWRVSRRVRCISIIFISEATSVHQFQITKQFVQGVFLETTGMITRLLAARLVVLQFIRSAMVSKRFRRETGNVICVNSMVPSFPARFALKKAD